ncbi:MAG TPA: LysR family transcriptional regulator substrate-binding protein, partial [Candidatus Limnocylindrales bacterium]|nr:LysR family transcriptional regulator substrate-binding protein [Candidatus Limnocylindrales bacterium]
VVPELIARLRRRYPGVHVIVRTGRSRAILDLVARGEAQLGLVHDLPDERVVAEPLYEEELSLVARPDHPFAYEGWVTLERLREATLVLFDPSSTYYERTDALLRAAGVVPHSRIEVDNIEVACRLVARGIGVALLPTTSTAESIAAGALSAIGLAGVEPIRGRVVLVERPGAPDWEPLAHLRRLARAIPESIPGARPVSDAAARPGPRRAAARRAPPPGSGPGSRRPARTR